VAFLLARRIIGPVAAASEVAEHIANGKLDENSARKRDELEHRLPPCAACATTFA
jgi:hypothetical protein